MFIVCVTIKVSRLMNTEKIPPEYLNNRNSLMSKMDQFVTGPFGHFQTH